MIYFFLLLLNVHYKVAVILLLLFQMLLQNTTEKMFCCFFSHHNDIRLSSFFWPEAPEVLMALPVLEMSELIRFTKPCNKWSVQISASVRQSFNKNKALLQKEESKSTLLTAFILLLQTQRHPYGRWTSPPTYQKQDPGTWLFFTSLCFRLQSYCFLS